MGQGRHRGERSERVGASGRSERVGASERSETSRTSERDLWDLTVAEQLVGAGLFLGTWGVLHLALTAAGASGLTHPWLLGPALGLAYSGVVGWYVGRHDPWRGPARLRRSAAARRTGSRAARIRDWWRQPGRRGLLWAAGGLFLVLAGFLNAADDKALLRALRDRGVTTDALVSRVRETPRGGLDSVTLRFTVAARTMTEDDCILDTVPGDIAEGQRVRVVYDPQDPARVLLTSQLNDDHVTADYWAAALGGVGAVAGLTWWRLLRGERRRRVSAR